MEFGRDWRRVCKTNRDKYEVLIQIGGERLGKIFHNEISFGLLGEFILALDCEYEDSHQDRVLDILHGLSTTNRFSLSVQFLTAKEKEAMKVLFGKCSALLKKEGAPEEIIESYKGKLHIIKEKYEL